MALHLALSLESAWQTNSLLIQIASTSYLCVDAATSLAVQLPHIGLLDAEQPPLPIQLCRILIYGKAQQLNHTFANCHVHHWHILGHMNHANHHSSQQCMQILRTGDFACGSCIPCCSTQSDEGVGQLRLLCNIINHIE